MNCCGTFWRGITLDTDTRLRVGRAVAKTEEQVAHELMAQLKDRGHPDAPPAMATEGKGDYREALVETWGQVPEYGGVGRPPTVKRPEKEWQYLQIIKARSGSRLIGVTIKVIFQATGRAHGVVRLGRLGLQYCDISPSV
jgi:hypothetical protein